MTNKIECVTSVQLVVAPSILYDMIMGSEGIFKLYFSYPQVKI